MDKQKFYYQVTSRSGPNSQVITFESDNVFKDAAKMMMDIDINLYPSGCTIKFWDDNGDMETYGVVRTRDGGFFLKCYTFDKPNNLQHYIDYDLPPRYLTYLDDDNEYKYYTLTFNKTDGQCYADFGRLGQDKGTFNYGDGKSSKDGTYQYSPEMFWVKYYEKISKGYEDHSEEKDFDLQKKSGGKEYKPIEEKEIRRIMEYLIARQRDYVQENFDLSVPSSEVAIKNAKALIEKMEIIANRTDIDNNTKTKEIVAIYKQLVMTLPRKISDVATYINRFDFIPEIKDNKGDLIDNPNFIGNILEHEHELLQNFEDIYVYDHSTKEEQVKLQKDILEDSGLKAYLPTFKEKWMAEDRTCSKNGNGQIEDERHLVSRVLLVENTKTKENYEKAKKELHIANKDCHLFFHGSRTENWWSIFKNGMSLNPNAVTTGKMFGYGLYFAPLARKSLGYTDFRGSCWSHGTNKFGYLALFETAMGKAYNPAYGSLYNDAKRLMAAGYNSTWAKAGYNGYLRNEECIVYREDQCNIKYLIEMDADRQTFKNFKIEDIRKLKCTEPVYDKDTDTIIVKCDAHNYISSAKDGCELIYDCKAERIAIKNNGQEISLYGNEKEYIMDVYMSNFADSPVTYREWEKAFKDGRDLNAQKTPLNIVLPITPLPQAPTNTTNNVKPVRASKKQKASGDNVLFGVTKGIICQQVNCCGAMRTDVGLSGAIYADYPQVKEAYDDMYSTAKINNPNNPHRYNQPTMIGAYQVVNLNDNYTPYKQGDDLLSVNYIDPSMMDGDNKVKDENGLYVANIYGQQRFGNPYKTGEVFTELDKLAAAIKDIAESNPNTPVYIPHSVKNGEDVGLGCGYGGEKWENVFKELKKMKLDNIYLLDTNTGKSRKVRLDKDLIR